MGEKRGVSEIAAEFHKGKGDKRDADRQKCQLQLANIGQQEGDAYAADNQQYSDCKNLAGEPGLNKRNGEKRTDDKVFHQRPFHLSPATTKGCQDKINQGCSMDAIKRQQPDGDPPVEPVRQQDIKGKKTDAKTHRTEQDQAGEKNYAINVGPIQRV